ncbi:F-box domain-containing protein [Favolaschia claudopus]|uniref:F-box domain-containing protein n=1 Tax=Favolaschia claudopus TaxID=2862362 RepID=A0AAW0CNP7_9AGAR
MLPDEIISEILSPALKVPDKLFADTSDVSPFATYTVSTSAYLLVCKDWLRVATPLLYDTVVLRSKSQANALEKVLRRNPEFSAFINKLRVEGGYGAAMQTILASVSSLQDLWLSLSIWSSDSTVGLCKGLPRTDPKRVIIFDPLQLTSKPPKNKQLDALVDTLLGCIKTWHLLTISIPYGSEAFPIRLARAEKLVDSVTQSTSIQTVHIAASFVDLPPFIRRLTNSPSIRAIEFLKSHSPALRSTVENIPELKALVHFVGSGQAIPDAEKTVPDEVILDISPSLNPFFAPLSSASDATRDLIWGRILFFALETPGALHAPTRPPGSSPSTHARSSRLSILYVSKYFNRLALPYLYESLSINQHNAEPIAEQMKQYDSLGPVIHSVLIDDYQIAWVCLQTIISRATNLKVFADKTWNAGSYLDLELFMLLASTAGPSLQELRVGLDFFPSSASLFQSFHRLRILDLRIVEHSLSPNVPLIPTMPLTSDAPGLESLHTLRVIGSSAAFLATMSTIRLPSLHTITLPIYIHDGHHFVHFMKTHGERILHLVVGSLLSCDMNHLLLCPNLIDIEFRGEYNLDPTVLTAPHNCLTKITASRLPEKTSALEVDMLPFLREIRLRDFKWPTTEREIKKSGNVAIAESLQRRGIKFFDSTGMHWIPRVKSSRGRN